MTKTLEFEFAEAITKRIDERKCEGFCCFESQGFTIW